MLESGVEMKKNLILIILIICITFFLVLFFNKTYARYINEATVEGKVGVALPVLRNNINSISVPLNDIDPGETKTYNFYVSNFNLDNNDNITNISEVTLEYYIFIERSTNLPVNIKLTELGDTNNILTSTRVEDKNTILTTDRYTLTHGSAELKNYVLTIDWPQTYNDENYSNLIEYLIVNIYAEQKIS